MRTVTPTVPLMATATAATQKVTRSSTSSCSPAPACSSRTAARRPPAANSSPTSNRTPRPATTAAQSPSATATAICATTAAVRWDVVERMDLAASLATRNARNARNARNQRNQRNQESGIRNQESGIRNQESGIRNQESGIRNQESGIGVGSRDAGSRDGTQRPPLNPAPSRHKLLVAGSARATRPASSFSSTLRSARCTLWRADTDYSFTSPCSTSICQ